MKIDSNDASAEMSQLFFAFEGHPPSNQAFEWERVEKYVTRLAESGWTRKEIYNLVGGIAEAHASLMPEECSDAISNYIDGLVGWVAVGYMVRLPGEPSDPDEHACFVRGREWLC